MLQVSRSIHPSPATRSTRTLPHTSDGTPTAAQEHPTMTTTITDDGDVVIPRFKHLARAAREAGVHVNFTALLDQGR